MPCIANYCTPDSLAIIRSRLPVVSHQAKKKQHMHALNLIPTTIELFTGTNTVKF